MAAKKKTKKKTAKRVEAKAWRVKRKCGVCGGRGHNRRSCGRDP